MKKASINAGSRVSLQFQLKLADGTLIDETRPGEKFEFVIGDGTLIAGLEQRLLDLRASDQVTFNIPAEEEVYGHADPENVKVMLRSDFPESLSLDPGSVVGFDLPNGDEVLGVVKEASDEEVTVDFNHPLIGRDFVFEVTVLAVESDAREDTDQH